MSTLRNDPWRDLCKYIEDNRRAVLRALGAPLDGMYVCWVHDENGHLAIAITPAGPESLRRHIGRTIEEARAEVQRLVESAPEAPDCDLSSLVDRHAHELAAVLGWRSVDGVGMEFDADPNDHAKAIRLLGSTSLPLGDTIDEALACLRGLVERRQLMEAATDAPPATATAGTSMSATAPATCSATASQPAAKPLFLIEYMSLEGGVSRWWIKGRLRHTIALAEAGLYSADEAVYFKAAYLTDFRCLSVEEAIAEAERNIEQRRADIAALRARVAAGGAA